MTLDRAPGDDSVGRGFRPGSRRRNRIAAGVAIAAVAVGGNVLLYSSLNDSTEVVQFVSNISAGDLIGSDDVRVIEIDGDPGTANLVTADQIGSVVNRYARTFIPSGSLASVYLVQADPLVSPGSAVVAIAPTDRLVPTGLTERSRVRLVIGDDGATLVDARVVSVGDDDGDGVETLSVEDAEGDAPSVAAAGDLSVILLDPEVDPATEGAG